VGLGGFLGAIARYGVAGLVSRPEESFPWGTFLVNASGSFLLGFLVATFARTVPVHPDLRVAVTVGFIGAYTTFSTFALETTGLASAGALGSAIINVMGSVVVGLAAVWLGQAAARLF
jgi:CrcB protein